MKDSNDKSTENGGFKLVAITPLIDCHSDYSKALERGKVYQFYKNYDISNSPSLNSVDSCIRTTSSLPTNFFDLDNGIRLNISAVVGENGSGKSSLFELFYYLIYEVFIQLKVNEEFILAPKSKELENRISGLVQDIRVEKINALLNEGKHYDDSIELRIAELINEYKLYSLRASKRTGKDLWRELLKQLNDIKESLNRELKAQKERETLQKQGVNASMIFEKDGICYELEHSKKEFRYYKFDKISKAEMHLDSLGVEELSQLFYTISINYSAHALNSVSIGNWISRLFHKNDAYVTPLVINPMRTEGNYDINREMHLAKERLLTNILYDSFNKTEALILGKYHVTEIIFSVKKNYRFISPINYDKTYFLDNLTGRLISGHIGTEKIELLPEHGRAIAYLDKKIEKIKTNYGFLIFSKKSSKKPDDVLLDFLLKDDSHITKKVKQTLNFIKYTIQRINYWNFDDFGNCKFTLDQMINWIAFCVTDPKKTSPFKLIEYCFPGYFDVNFTFSNESLKYELNDQSVDIEKLSSGELQMILNINTIQYHLYNLQSVHDESKEQIDLGNRVKYQCINIVLDEIELYYHPNMQRQMVQNVIKSIERVKLKGDSGISSINICFLTHSPFILSDIPKENILRLGVGEDFGQDEEEETFAANIQDIMSNGFFMKVLIGEFAFEKLMRAFVDLKQDRNDQTIENVRELLEYVGDPMIKNQIKNLIND